MGATGHDSQAMSEALFVSDHPVTLVGGGYLGASDLENALRLAPDLIAADCGADAALKRGKVPLVVIGDMDSISEESLASLPAGVAHRITEQDSTDFEKVLCRVRVSVILAVGFLGGRLDHQLAAVNALVRHPDSPCILIGAEELVFAVPRAFRVSLDPGDRVSLFPLRKVRGRSTGLHWPINGLTLSPGGRVGTSNRATGVVTLRMNRTGLIGTIPRSALPNLMRELAVAPPAHGGVPAS